MPAQLAWGDAKDSKTRRTSHGMIPDIMRTQLTIAVVGVIFSLAALAQAPAPQNPPAPANEISADLGPCSAQFKVTDLAGKPIYNATITVQIRYGFMAQRKLDLEAHTDANGKVKFVKMPGQARRPITFKISYGPDTAAAGFDPATNCDPSYVVPLGKK